MDGFIYKEMIKFIWKQTIPDKSFTIIAYEWQMANGDTTMEVDQFNEMNWKSNQTRKDIETWIVDEKLTRTC